MIWSALEGAATHTETLLQHFQSLRTVKSIFNTKFNANSLLQSRWHFFFFLWKIETTHKDRCTQYGVTSTNVKLSSWKSDRMSMTLLPTQQKKNWNRPNESATRWRVLKLFDQGGKTGLHHFSETSFHRIVVLPKRHVVESQLVESSLAE